MASSGKKFVLSLLFLSVIAVVGFMVVNGKATNGEKRDVRYKEFTVKRGYFRIEVNASGLAKPIKRVEIKSKASGEIVSLPVEEGTFIKKGDLIARLDQRDEASSVALAKADLVIAEAEQKQAQLMFNRRKKLFLKKIISEEERDRIGLQLAVAKGKVIQASTTLDRAQDRLSDSVVRSPVNGIVLKKYVEKGQIISSGVSNVSGGTPIVDIAAMHTVYIEAGIDEIDIGKVAVGQSASVVAEAYPRFTFSGKVIRISPEAKVEQNVTLFDVIVEVENKDGKLKSGMNTHIQITTLNKTDVLLAPVIALQTTESDETPQNTKTVLVKEGGEFVNQRVTIGLADFKQAEILSGLKEGDILGVEMTSRLIKDNERLEKRIKRSRSFGVGSKKKKKKDKKE